MASGFERAHSEELLGALTTVDRLIVHGHLSRLWFPNHMAYFLNRLGVHIVRDFGQFVKQASSKVIAHAEALASLDIVFHVAGSLLAPEFEGIRTGSFSRKKRILQIQIAVPASIVASSDPYPFLAARICEAVHLAKPVFDGAGINYPEDEYAALAGRLADMGVH